MGNVKTLSGEDYRQLPSSPELEQSLLGCILINNTAFEKINLKPSHFYEPLHGRIFEVMQKMYNRGQAIDPLKLKPYFKNDEALEQVEGWKYFVRLAGSAPTVFNPEDYAEAIKDLAIRRELIGVGQDVIQTAYDSPVDLSAQDQIRTIEQKLYALGDEDGQKEAVPLGKATKHALEAIKTARKSPSHVSGVSTGLGALDRLSGGLHKSDLIILAGCTSMGKTALATNIALAAPVPVGFFSLEMSHEQIANRIIGQMSGISSERLRRGELNQTEMREVIRSEEKLREREFYIDQTPGMTITDIRTKARRLKRLRNIGLLVVDYLQLARGFTKDTREREINDITQGLKNIAKELDIPVLALAQLSRAVDARLDKRPLLSDLRESGAIEQHADEVIFLYRPEYYLEKKKPDDVHSKDYKKWSKKMEKWKDKAEIIFAKRRHGQTGSVVLGFNGKITKFFD
ncbi:replicative DNA helicase [candidate division KSB1 bacterium]|nr:replicative DNA helicase [candidate division KSB1 bacterium]NIV70648.1 replicative DNA helicase [Phycisphaerae bacterium]NIS28179.1 replicative DNA helicase [candidate division KSB1 bacterium]NIT75072.1 replicative DNA helicase [candidate division KSB1 bacterium]NIU28858.1 replicative DNA helicase [candidate division KSB1 bacterium]